MTPLWLGLDIGTSGVRAAVVDRSGAVVSAVRVPLDRRPLGPGEDANAWWSAARECLVRQTEALDDPSRLVAMAIDGTSGSMVMVDGGGVPVGAALRYDTKGFDAEAERIGCHAPEGSITRGAGSALARFLRLASNAPASARLAHEADFVVAQLTRAVGVSDESNALKTGWDAEARQWPNWFAAAGVPMEALPRVVPVGEPMGTVGAGAARETGLPEGLRVVAGTTDSVAAFLAAGSVAPGTAVTSLGTTLALKIVSPVRIEDASRGVYSHRVGDAWIAGGASNVGGGTIAMHFTADEVAALTPRLDPERDTGLDYVPLPRPGERFPVADAGLAPRLEPRPDDDAEFLQGMLEGIARTERNGYRTLEALGAPYPTRVLTAGGGARNGAWAAIRARMLGVPVEPSPEAEASVGMARLALSRVPA